MTHTACHLPLFITLIMSLMPHYCQACYNVTPVVYTVCLSVCVFVRHVCGLCHSDHSTLIIEHFHVATTMGVDHGGTGEHVTCPPEFRVGDVMEIIPIRFCHISTKRAFCGLQNTPKSVFGGGSAPDPAGGAHDAPQTPSRLERGHSSPYPTPLSTDPPSALAMRPPRISARSMPMATAQSVEFHNSEYFGKFSTET